MKQSFTLVTAKQNLPAALAVFDPSTIAAIQQYYPENQDSTGFLHLVHVWWTLPNSKVQFNSRNKMGNAVVEGDSYPDFLMGASLIGSRTGKIKKSRMLKKILCQQR